MYSLAATLYHLLAGRPPFLPAPDEGLYPLLRRIGTERHRTSRATMCRCGCGRVLLRGLAKDPADRFATAAEFTRALRQVQVDHQTGLAPPVPPVECGVTGSVPVPETTMIRPGREVSAPVEAEPGRPRRARTAAYVAAALAAVVALVTAVAVLTRHGPPPAAAT